MWFIVVVSLDFFSFGKLTNPQLLLPPLLNSSQPPVPQTQSQLADSTSSIIAGAAKWAV